MKLKFSTLAAIIVVLSVLCSCSSNRTTSVVSAAAYTSPETVIVNTEHDGTVTLRVWGKGSNKADAIEQAKKNAVYDVIFKNLRGASGNTSKALVTEVNARERYANYFDPFFADGGEYLKFVKEEKANDASRLESKGSSIYNYGILATVNRSAIRDQLVRDGVLRP